MFVPERSSDLGRICERRGIQESRAGTGKVALTCKSNTTSMSAGKGRSRILLVKGFPAPPSRGSVPKLLTFSFQPPGTATLGEAGCLVTAPSASSWGRLEDGLWEHEEFAPSEEGVGGSDIAQSPGQTLGPHAPGGFGHMAQDRDVSRENGGKVRQGITAIGRGKGCSRRRQHSLPSSRPATAMSAIVACRNKHPANGAMVQAMCAAITTGHSASQGPCSMSIQVRAHGGMRLPADGCSLSENEAGAVRRSKA